MADALLPIGLLRREFTQQPRPSISRNLLTPLVDMLNGEARMGRFQNAVKWDLNIGGRTATGQATTADAVAATSDTGLGAELPIGEARLETTIDVLTTDVSEAARVAGPDSLRSLFRAKIDTSRQVLKTDLATKLYAGTGIAADGGLVGLSTAADSAGAYAGVTNGSWVSTEFSTVGALTLGMLEDGVESLEIAGIGSFSYVITTPTLVKKYKQLFSDYRRQIGDSSEFAMNLSPTALFFGGRPVISDPYCPAGTVFLGGGLELNSRVIPAGPEGLDSTDATVLDPFIGMDVLVKALPSNNPHGLSWSVSIMPQLQLHDRRSFVKYTGVT